MKKLITDPLLHFLMIGAALFLVFGMVEDPAENPENRIIITEGDIESLKANFARTWRRPPTETELERLIEDQVRDEISYREAVAMGLDQNDRVIRKRLRMKMELLAEDMAGLKAPTEEDLKSFLSEHRDTFRRDARISFKHVYLNSDRRGTQVEKDARELLSELSTVGASAGAQFYGDSIMLPKEFIREYAGNIERILGKSFSQDLLQIEPGVWTGPVRSSYGLHLVYVDEHIAARDPELAEVRQEVEREWIAKRRKNVKEEIYKTLRKQYKIVIEHQEPSEDGKK
jgi:hypothetical protein